MSARQRLSFLEILTPQKTAVTQFSRRAAAHFGMEEDREPRRRADATGRKLTVQEKPRTIFGPDGENCSLDSSHLKKTAAKLDPMITTFTLFLKK